MGREVVLLEQGQLERMRKYVEAVRAFDEGEPSDTLDRANYGYYFTGAVGAVNILALLDTIDALHAAVSSPDKATDTQLSKPD